MRDSRLFQITKNFFFQFRCRNSVSDARARAKIIRKQHRPRLAPTVRCSLLALSIRFTGYRLQNKSSSNNSMYAPLYRSFYAIHSLSRRLKTDGRNNDRFPHCLPVHWSITRSVLHQLSLNASQHNHVWGQFILSVYTPRIRISLSFRWLENYTRY